MSTWLSFVFASLLHVVSQPSASELAARIEALSTTGRVLYVAAHPDDENTQMLAWLRGEFGYRAAYISITRGDGGQNLIGAEQAPLLGIMRTWELLAARYFDGAEQFIGTRRDFGYSKSAEETLAIWDEDEAVRDLVAVIRDFRPHAIVTRFPEVGDTHGHHLASGRVARLAFAAAADPTYDAGENRAAWQAQRLLHNVPSWNLTPEQVDPAWHVVDVGGYSEDHQRSWGELAAVSRSSHRSQGFGWASRRGPQPEYITVLEGDAPQNGDLLGGIDTSWAAAVPGAPVARLGEIAVSAAATCRSAGPSSAVPALADMLALAQHVSDPALKAWLIDELGELIVSAAGLVLDARTTVTHVVPGDTLAISLQALLRTSAEVAVLGAAVGDVVLAGDAASLSVDATMAPLVTLATHTPQVWETQLPIAAVAATSTHFWLDNTPLLGGDTVADALRGASVSSPPVLVDFWLRVYSQNFRVQRPARNVFVDPVYGERPRAVEVLPPVTVTPRRDVAMLVDGVGAVEVAVHANAAAATDVRLEVPAGWRVEPASVALTLEAGDSAVAAFEVRAPEGASAVEARVVARVGEREFAQRIDRIDYPHIPIQSVLRPATLRLAPIEIQVPALRVGELAGPGDGVAEGLADIGLAVRAIDPGSINAATLAEYDAILVGIRAFNVEPTLHSHLPALLDWVAAGGVLLVQYQTNSRIGPLAGNIGPAPLVIGRGRVTDENATMRPLDGATAIWNTPNALTSADYAGWVQERGLYFAESWDAAWQPVLGLADPGEDEQLGALMIAEHGQGRVIYTGLAFFRQLPAGVSGAHRLLVNLLTPPGAAP